MQDSFQYCLLDEASDHEDKHDDLALVKLAYMDVADGDENTSAAALVVQNVDDCQDDCQLILAATSHQH